MPLDVDDLGLLRFERQSWRSSAAKNAAIGDQFGCTPLRYYQRLAVLIDNPDALAADPILVGRLRRIRDRRRARLHPPRAETTSRG